MRRRKRKTWLFCCVLALLSFGCGMNAQKWQDRTADSRQESIPYGETASNGSQSAALQVQGTSSTETAAPDKKEQGTKEPGRKFRDEFDKARYEIGLDEEAYTELWEAQQGNYAFSSLSDPEKYWYTDMYAILAGFASDIELHAEENEVLGVAGIDRVFQCVMNDHPELFFVDGYTYTQYTLGEDTVRITFSGSYTMDQEEAAIRKQQIDSYTKQCLAGIDPQASQYDKVKYIYDYIVTHTEYDQQAAENQNICSVFIGRQSVCQGYAKATQYLLNLLKVKTTLVIGQVDNGQGHAWNLVQIDGRYYYVDTTWGDASYQEAEEQEQVDGMRLPTINYDYLCVTTAQLCRTHTIQNVVPMPECSSMDANYYVMEDLYFTSFEEDRVAGLFAKAYAMGRSDVTLKCADQSVYDTFLQELIMDQKIFRFLEGDDKTVAYAENPVQLSLIVWLAEN